MKKDKKVNRNIFLSGCNGNFREKFLKNLNTIDEYEEDNSNNIKTTDELI